jgi:hypothetical protein
VAVFCAKHDPKLQAMFDYIDNISGLPRKKDEAGFGCFIDNVPAMAWIEKNKPHLIGRLKSISAGCKLSEEEDDVR